MSSKCRSVGTFLEFIETFLIFIIYIYMTLSCNGGGPSSGGLRLRRALAPLFAEGGYKV